VRIDGATSDSLGSILNVGLFIYFHLLNHNLIAGKLVGVFSIAWSRKLVIGIC
jgi:hypothetical protein